MISFLPEKASPCPLFATSVASHASTRRSSFTLAIFLMLVAGAALTFGQSTFATVVGIVRDPAGAAVPSCVVTIENLGTSAKRSTVSDPSGNYQFPNLEAGNYKVMMQAPGFQVATYTAVELTARQTLRIDGQLTVSTQVESVNVTAAATAVINTEISNIAETKTGRELVDLPIAITSRSTGSTSPMATLTTQPGVQTDSSGGISVAGSKPSMLSMSIDGISSMGPRSSGPLAELFPSFNSIAEIRVSEVNNSAEFGGISDITTISKSGTNTYHGGVFENIENTSLTARNTFNSTKPTLHMNDFGAFGGGAVVIPHLYNGKDKTFFFASYEGLRLPRQQVLVESVPSLALRSGDLSVYKQPVYNPKAGAPYTNNQIPLTDVAPTSLNALKYFFPLPNTGPVDSISNNYVLNLPVPISSNQEDLRLDQNIGGKQTVFARGTYKKRSVIAAPFPGGSPALNGTALIGGVSVPEIDYGMTVAHNYVLSPTMVNEFRIGFNGSHLKVAWGLSAAEAVRQLGINLPSVPDGNAVPNFKIAGFQQTGGSRSDVQLNNTFQILDNFTWSKGKHTVKFGGDYRYMTGYYANVFATSRVGQFTYNGSKTNTVNGTPYINNPYAAFLLGIPDKTQLATVQLADTSAYAGAWALYAQDDWKITPRLTLNYGLRYEYHPMFKDHFLNVTQFDPNYTSVVNGVTVPGAAVVPNDESMKLLNPGFAESIYPTPVITAKQDGIPEALRYVTKTDFAPRIGLAWRPFADGKTVIRGGYGRFIQGTLGNLVAAAWGIHASDVAIFNQSFNGRQPALTFPYPFPSNIAIPGSQGFYNAGDIHFKDAWVNQWNFTIERELGFGTGLRLSYDGNHGSELGVTTDQNQIPASKLGYDPARSPFPVWSTISTSANGGWSNYNAVTASVNKRFSKGVQFQSSYTFARNLSNGAGYTGGGAFGSGITTGFASEAGGNVSDRFNLGQDYGNVAFTHRHRFLTTFLYQLPFGRGGLVGNSINRGLDQVIGGWELAGVLLFQSGPFLTATVPGPDPQGNNFPNIIGDVRPDSVSGVSLYPTTQTWSKWLNPGAFSVPGDNIGRFGNAPVGNIIGPGTQAVSASLMKSIKFTENMRLQFGAQAANLFNHPNYAPPNTSFNTANFGTVSNLQSAEGAGPRIIQGTARFTF